MINFQQQHNDLKRRIIEGIKSIFPIEGKLRKLVLEDVEVKEVEDDDYQKQLSQKLKGGSFGSPVYAKVALKDDKKVISRARIKVAHVPRITQRGSYIIDGSEYQVPNQLRLRPGVFHRTKENGELEGFINVQGFQAKVLFDPEKVQFLLNIRTVNIKLLPLLIGLGVQPETIRATWGSKTYDQAFRNSRSNPEAELQKLYKATFGRGGKDPANMRLWMDGHKLDPRVTKKTLQGQESISPDVLLSISKRLLDINRGKSEQDERDSLEFKTVHGVDDFIYERFQKMLPEIRSKLKRNVDIRDEVRQIVQPSVINKPINSFFTTSALSATTEQTNPLHMIGETNKIVITGEGGIENQQTITDAARIAHPSQLGIIDPLHTPESGQIGVTNHLSILSSKEGNDLFTHLRNAKTGKVEKVRTDVSNNVTIAFADEYKDGKPKSNKIMASKGGKISWVSPKDVDYIMVSDKALFDVASNLAPFLHSNSGNRGMMAGKHMEQTLPLINREAPLVQTQLNGTTSFENSVGSRMNVRAKVDGVITKISKDFIHIGNVKHSLYDHFPVRAKVHLTHTPVVKVGDKVKKNQLLAELNYNKGDTFSLGTNLSVGYISYKGHNFEDGIVITEHAASQLSSDHMHHESTSLDSNSTLNKKKFVALYPTAFTARQLEKIDENGIVKKGVKLEYGDPIVLKLQKEEMTREDAILASFRKSVVRNLKNRSLVWTEEDPGEVIRINQTRKEIDVHVKTSEPMKIGDKMAGRHGNKGTVTCYDSETEILTRSGWKRFEDVSHDDKVLTYNPIFKCTEYHNPTALIKKPHNGSMYKFQSRRLDVMTTMDHSWWVRKVKPGNNYQFETPEEFGTYPRCVKKSMPAVLTEGKGTFTIPGISSSHKRFQCDTEYESDDFYEFLGWYLSEGCVSRDGYHIHISQSKSAKPDFYDEITSLIDRLGYNYYEGDEVIVFSDPRLAAWLKPIGLSLEKYIPRDVIEHASPNQLLILLTAAMKGDGGVYFREKDNHTRYELFTSSKQLSDDYQEVAIRIGLSANIKPQIRSGRNNIEYVVRITKKEETFINNDKRVSSGEVIQYNGFVYCVDVPNHIICVRRNGIPHWNGNCIIPDSEALITESGRRIDVYLNPDGVPGRVNPSQNLEMATSKIAEKTGKPFLVENFSGKNYLDEIIAEHKKLGIKDKEKVKDPKTGQYLDEEIQTGKQYIIKMDHSTRKKFSARAQDGYTMDNQPTQGEGKGGQSMDKLTMYSMLAHGSHHNLREMSTLKGDRNDEFWHAYQAGLPLPSPRVPFVFEKFKAMLAASGVDMERKGDNLNLVPMTEKEVTKLSGGALKNPFSVRSKDLKEEKGGIFDTKITGGLNGDKWSHIELAEPMPMPMYEEAILAITGMRKQDLEDILANKLYVDTSGNITSNKTPSTLSGGKGLHRLLSKIDLNAERIRTEAKARKAKGSDLDKLNRKLRYISALQKSGTKLTEYMTKKVPVIPPKFRSILQQKNGDLIIPDANNLYADLIKVNNQLRDIDHLPDSEKANLRKDVYASMKAIVGTGDALTKKGSRDWKGYIKQIAGTSPKFGYYQSKVISKRQDFTGRSTIVPEPDYGLDELGIPEEMAWKIYRPHVIRRMTKSMGYSPLDARTAIEEKRESARKALMAEMKERPVMMNRAPSLHKFAIMAFTPKITSGKAIKLNPLVVGGFNADFDGDSGRFLLALDISTSTMQAHYNLHGEELHMPFAASTQIETTRGLFHIQDIPVKPDSMVQISDTVQEWDVIDNVFINAMDRNTGDVSPHLITKVSKHIGCKLFDIQLSNGSIKTVTDDHSLVGYNHKDDSISKIALIKPEDSLGKLIPVTKNQSYDLIDSVTYSDTISYNIQDAKASRTISGEINLGRYEGRLFGIILGDGWIDYMNRVYVASQYEEIFDEINTISNMSSIGITRVKRLEFDRSGGFGPNEKAVRIEIGVAAGFARWLATKIGKGAENKRVPDFSLNSNKEHIIGLIEGMMSTDGTVSVNTSAKRANSQLIIQYSTISPDLRDGFIALCSRLGIKATATLYKAPSGKNAYCISLSTTDIKSSGIPFNFISKHKQSAFEEYINSVGVNQNDVVPYPEHLHSLFNSVILHIAEETGRNPTSVGSGLSSSKKRGYWNRDAAIDMLKYIDSLDESVLAYKTLILDRTTTWSKVTAVEFNSEMDCYDITVPGPLTFATSDGVIVQDTMSVHVPVTNEAKNEAYNMMPSKNLINPQSNTLEHKPTKESTAGLYVMTLPPRTLKPKAKFNTISQLENAYRAHKVRVRDVVVVRRSINTVGRHLINDALPKKYKSKNIVLDKKGLSELLTKIAKEDKDDYPGIVNRLKNLGNIAAYTSAISFGLVDLKLKNPEIIRREFLKMERSLMAARDKNKWIADWSAKPNKITTYVEGEINKSDSGLSRLMNSSLAGKKGQIQQMIAGPMFVNDYKNEPVPVLIKSGFAGGLKTGEYWTTLAGARKGMMDRALSTMKSGFFSKEVMANVLNGKITEKDCGTTQGIEVNLSDNSLHYMDRYTASGNSGIKENELVTPELIQKIKKAGSKTIWVRSPLTCKARNAPCSKCFGLDQDGKLPKVGDNLGAIAGQSLSEPSTQLTMKTFHTGGAIGGGGISGFQKAQQLLKMPKIVPDKATLASKDGNVISVRPAPQGGWNIDVDTVVHYATEKPIVKPGQGVKKGQTLTEGNVKPQELAELTDAVSAKRMVVNEIASAYESNGRTVRKPLIEVAVGQIIRHGQVTDPGGDKNVVIGDYLPINEIEYRNKTLKRPIKYTEVVKGINTSPFQDENFLALLQFNHIPQTIMRGAAQQWSSDLHGPNPIPGYAMGAEFGLGSTPGADQPVRKPIVIQRESQMVKKSEYTGLTESEQDFLNGLRG